jgi:dipeptidyl aminopeptidase/acylaminoacyl peptidase
MITDTKTTPVTDPTFPPGVERLDYRSTEDDIRDWALAMPGQRDEWIVHLHGGGSTGDQIFTRADIRDLWLAHYLKRGCGVLSPNLRGDAWMCPEASSDLKSLLEWVRGKYPSARFIFVSGSMGGTGNLIYAVLHPEDVSAAVALCPVTDILAFYHQYPAGRAKMEKAYGGTPDQVPETYQRHRVIPHVSALRMPLFLSHGDADPVIPVEHSRKLFQLLKDRGNAEYIELPGGDHDAPLYEKKMLKWLDRQL